MAGGGVGNAPSFARAGKHELHRQAGLHARQVGGVLLELQPGAVQQGELDLQDDDAPDSRGLMTTLG